MTQSTAPNTPIVILACKVFQNWLEHLLPEGLACEVTFFDYGLHQIPKNLRQTIQTAIDSIEQPSLVVLGYGLCGNGLDAIQAGQHTLLIPRVPDCIALLLGSYAAYLAEFEREPGTYYLSKGWLEAGSNPLAESRELEKKYGAKKAAFVMNVQYHNYRRLMFVARNPEELAAYRPLAQEVAAYCAQWGMRYEEIWGADTYLQRLAEVARALDQAGEDFIVVPPGGVLTQMQFVR